MKYFSVTGSRMHRWIVFNAVGAMGFAVQMSALYLLVHFAGLHYLPATALAVETAVLHNFIWHENWTWIDRSKGDRTGRFKRLVYFHLANGIVSIAGNVLLMRIFAGMLKMHYITASVFSLALCAVLNFLAGDRLVFRSFREPFFNGD
jgi:putative flippase GtrA